MSDQTSVLPWSELNDYLLSLSSAASPTEFASAALNGLKQFIPFQRAITLFYDVNGECRNCCLVGYDERLSKILLEYYLGRFSAPLSIDLAGNVVNNLGRGERYNRAGIDVTDWTQHSSDEFVQDYVKTYGLKHSMNFELFDCRGSTSMVFNLDRVTNQRYTTLEIEIARYVIPFLNALNKKFYLRPPSRGNVNGRSQAIMEMAGLTRREKEIVMELCVGTSPANISKRLHISLATTHKHIAHIYNKLRVANLQEMLVKLLNPKGLYWRPG